MESRIRSQAIRRWSSSARHTGSVGNLRVASASHEGENWCQPHRRLHEDRLSEMRPRAELTDKGYRTLAEAGPIHFQDVRRLVFDVLTSKRGERADASDQPHQCRSDS